MKGYVVRFLTVAMLLTAAGCGVPTAETTPALTPEVSAEAAVSSLPETEPTETPSAIEPYDTNGDGVLQTIEFPVPTGEVFGLEGEDAELYSSVAAAVMELSVREYTGKENWMHWISETSTWLTLPHFTVVGEYDGENGEKNYICGLGIYDYYGLGEGLAKYAPQYRVYDSVGGGGAFSRIAFSADGTFLDVQQTYDGADNTERVKELCGPLTGVAEAWINGTDYPNGERALPDMDSDEMLERYVNYYFCREN